MSLGRHPQRNIILTGFHCAGKSAVGRELARRMRRYFIDADAEVRRRSRSGLRVLLPIGSGDAEDLERQVLTDFAYRRETIFELSPETVARGGLAELRDFSFVVFLDPPFEVLLERMRGERQGQELLENEGVERLRARWQELRPVLEDCDLQVMGNLDVYRSSALVLHSFYS